MSPKHCASSSARRRCATGRAQSSKSSSNPSHLVVGRIGRAVGLRGEVEVSITSDNPERFAVGAVVLRADDLAALTVRTRRTARAGTIVSFEEIPDRTGAEAVRGIELVVALDQARALDTGEYWDHDLIGCVVVTTDGEDLGPVADVLHAPGNDVLVVTGTTGEHLIPLIASVVLEVQPGQRIMIDPIPGLLD